MSVEVSRIEMAGIPPGVAGSVLSVLVESPGPWRRRLLLEELERRGHRISLAGLNRTLQQCADSGLTTEGPDGVRLIRKSAEPRPPSREARPPT